MPETEFHDFGPGDHVTIGLAYSMRTRARTTQDGYAGAVGTVVEITSDGDLGICLGSRLFTPVWRPEWTDVYVNPGRCVRNHD